MLQIMVTKFDTPTKCNFYLPDMKVEIKPVYIKHISIETLLLNFEIFEKRDLKTRLF